MLSFDYITEKGAALVRRYQTRNPFQIARELGIHVLAEDNFDKLKGMYKVIKRNRFIFINSNLSEQMQNIVCAHEVGHDQFHRDLAAKDGLREFIIYRMDTRPEYEANIFAAEILLPSDELLEYVKCGYDAEQIARTMHSDINLIALKVTYLIQQGYDLRRLDHKSDFLK